MKKCLTLAIVFIIALAIFIKPSSLFASTLFNGLLNGTDTSSFYIDPNCGVSGDGLHCTGTPGISYVNGNYPGMTCVQTEMHFGSVNSTDNAFIGMADSPSTVNNIIKFIPQSASNVPEIVTDLGTSASGTPGHLTTDSIVKLCKSGDTFTGYIDGLSVVSLTDTGHHPKTMILGLGNNQWRMSTAIITGDVSPTPTPTLTPTPTPTGPNDWPQFRYDTNHSGYNTNETTITSSSAYNLTKIWTASVVPCEGGCLFSPSADVVNGIVYTGSQDSHVYAFNAKTGLQVWAAPTSRAVLSTPAVVDGKVYVEDIGFNIYAFDSTNGTQLWHKQFSFAGDNNSLVVNNGVVYIAQQFDSNVPGGSLWALDATTGNILWRNIVTGSIAASPTFASEIINGSPESVVYACVRNGGSGTIYAYDAINGTTIWNHDINCFETTPAIHNGILYAGTSDGKIQAVDATNGTILWTSSSTGNSAIISSPAIANGLIYVGTQAGFLYAFDLTNGNVLWHTPLGGNIVSSPSVVNDVVFVGTQSNKMLYALNATYGHIIWAYTTDQGVTASPTVANNAVYIISDSGGGDGIYGPLYAFGIPNNPPSVNPLSDTTINKGNTFNQTGSFTDSDSSSSWTGTVDYGDGSGIQPLTLSGMNFSLSHLYTTTGNYTVTVTIADNQGATGQATATISVVIPSPTTLTSLADSYLNIYEQNQNEGGSPILRIENSAKYRTLVKFDEAAIQTAVSGDPNFRAVLQLTITDNGNNWGTGRNIEVDRITHDWSEGNGYVNGNPTPNRGTGSGVTWNCASDTNISNNTKDCSSSNIWDMDNSANWPFATPTATSLITNHESGIVSFDVTSDIQSFLNNTNQNYGWLLKKSDEGIAGKIDFGSKENGNGPVLIITPQ